MSSFPSNAVTLTKRGRIAIITINRPQKLNAMDQDAYYQLSCLLQDVAEMDDVSITVLIGSGRFFSAGADVTTFGGPGRGEETTANKDQRRRGILRTFVSNNLDTTRAFYTHPKILVTALNGPAVGLSAALIALSDFVYATPHAYLFTPFSSLGLVAEGGSSVAFVQRLGISKANEALIMSKRITSQELLQTGFVNKIFEGKDINDHEGFLAKVLEEVESSMGAHLNQESLLKIKALIRRPYNDLFEAQGAREAMEGMARLVSGAPQEEFRKIASGEKRHKL
jgi:Delta3-Delta2-enoyl-CoA isomerase